MPCMRALSVCILLALAERQLTHVTVAAGFAVVAARLFYIGRALESCVPWGVPKTR